MNRYLRYFLFILLGAGLAHFIAYKLVHIPRQLELVVILSALIFYPILKRPVIGLYLVIAVAPFIPYIRRLYYLVYTRPAIDPLIMVEDILLIFTLAGLYFVFKERRGSNQGVSFYSNLVLFYFGYMVARTFVFNYLPLEDAVTKFKYYGPPVLFFFVGAVLADTGAAHIKRLWSITVAVGIIAALYAVHQLYNGYSEAEMRWFSSIEFSTLFIKGIARPFSVFQAPVALADYMQLAVIGIFITMSWMQKKYHILLLAALPLLLYAALITSVRSSWVGIIATFVLWLLFFRLKKNSQRITVFTVLVLSYLVYQYMTDVPAAIAAAGAPKAALSNPTQTQQYFELLVSNRASALYDPLGEHSFLSRLKLWKDLIAYANDPILILLGRGLGCLNADSLYFTYLAEFGYPGMAYIIFLFIVFIIQGFYIIDNSKSRDIVAIAKGVVVINLVFGIISITGTHIHSFPGTIYFWFFNGVLIQLSAATRQEAAAAEEMHHAEQGIAAP